MKESTAKKDNAKVNSESEETVIKEIKPKRRKKRSKKFLILMIALIGFAFYSVITIINQNVQIADKKEELKELQQEINVVEIQTQYLKKVQGYTGDELAEYIEKIAKDDLGYVSNGERIFYNVAGD